MAGVKCSFPRLLALSSGRESDLPQRRLGTVVRLHVRSVQLPGGGEDSGRASALQENSATIQVALSVCHIWFVLQGGCVEVAELCIV